MTKKTLVRIVAIILVVASISVMFVGCQPKMRDHEYNDVLDKVISGMEKSINGNILHDLSVQSNLSIDLAGGGKTTKYDIDLAFQLDLKKDSTTAKNGLKLAIKENDKQVFGAYYSDWQGNANQIKDNYMYVAYNNPIDGNPLKLAVKVPDVRATLNAKKVGVNGDDINGDAVADLLSLLSIAARDCKMNNKNPEKATKATFSLPLTALLNETGEDSLGGILGGFSGAAEAFLKPLGIYLQLSELGKILPNIKIVFNFNFDKKTGAITTMDLTLGVDKSSTSINHGKRPSYDELHNPDGSVKPGHVWEKLDSKLLSIELANDASAKISVNNLTVGNANIAASNFKADFDEKSEGVKKVSAINMQIKGSLDVLDNDISISLDKLEDKIKDLILNILGTTKLSIAKGKYELDIQVDIDPTKLIDCDFNMPSTPYYVKDGKNIFLKLREHDGAVALETISGADVTTAEIDANGGVKWMKTNTAKKNTDGIIDAVVSAVNYLKIEFAQVGGQTHVIEVQDGKINKLEFFGGKLSSAIGNLANLKFLVKTVMGFLPAEDYTANEPDYTSKKEAYGSDRKKPEMSDSEVAAANQAALKKARESYNNLLDIGKALVGLRISIKDTGTDAGLNAEFDGYDIKDKDGKIIATISVPKLSINNKGLNAQIKFTPVADSSIAGFLPSPVNVNLALTHLVYGGSSTGVAYKK